MFDFFYDELDKAPPPLIPFDLSTIRRFVVIRGGRPLPPTRPHEVDCKIIVYDHLPNDGEEQGKETNQPPKVAQKLRIVGTLHHPNRGSESGHRRKRKTFIVVRRFCYPLPSLPSDAISIFLVPLLSHQIPNPSHTTKTPPFYPTRPLSSLSSPLLSHSCVATD